MTWCTVWRGTPHDCIDHMRKAHDIPATVKAANLAHWTVSREQWTIIMWSSVSGVAVDTLLFSRIGVPLFHRYRVFSWPGTHVAFRGTCMTRIQTFLVESVAASLRARHRRHTRAIASRMSQTTPREAPGSSSQPSMSRRSGSRVRRSAPAAAVAATSVTPGVVRSLRSSPRVIPAMMDLALPKFAHPGKRSERPQLPWIVMSEAPASPAPVRLRAPLRSPSPCLNLDTLSSDGSVSPGDVSDHPISISDVSSHSGGSDN